MTCIDFNFSSHRSIWERDTWSRRVNWVSRTYISWHHCETEPNLSYTVKPSVARELWKKWSLFKLKEKCTSLTAWHFEDSCKRNWRPLLLLLDFWLSGYLVRCIPSVLQEYSQDPESIHQDAILNGCWRHLVGFVRIRSHVSLISQPGTLTSLFGPNEVIFQGKRSLWNIASG